ncbi:MAG: hypothetical protein ACFFAS_04185 [Promethearchaeota archaeon]
MKSNQNINEMIKEHYGYDNDETLEFISNPRNQDVISNADKLANSTIVVEIVESHGCNSQHKVGDKFYLDGSGNVLANRCPKKMCIFALSELDKFVFAINELIYAGCEPNDLRFKRLGCCDVGLKCGGWGNIVMEVSVKERNQE